MSRAISQMIALLRDPQAAGAIADAAWTDILTAARAETLLASLGHRLQGQALPPGVSRVLDDAMMRAAQGHLIARWEMRCAARALSALGIPVVLMKGSAYLALDHRAAQGRQIGDLDIMVPRASLDAVEAALLGAGWEWVKDDPYDQAYYRQWMHELPPLIHAERDRMIDVHHTILPLTARPKPDADAMLRRAQPVDGGLMVLDLMDRLIHCAAHLFADGDLAGGLRNLWDFHCLMADKVDASALLVRAKGQGLEPAVARCLRLSAHLFGQPADAQGAARLTLTDRLFLRRLTARNGWGQETRPLTRLAFYIRSHWLRMPPLMLLRHLWIKWRKGKA